MARENQGLHIALIIFVMLTVILGVTTFLFLRQYQAAKLENQELTTKASEAEQGARNTLDENSTLKQQIGWTDTDKLPDITQSFTTEMTTFGAGIDEADRNYRNVMANLAKELQDTDARLNDALTKNQQLQGNVERLQQTYQSQVQQIEQRAQQAESDLSSERAKFNQERAAFTQKMTQAQAVLAQREQAYEQQIAQLTAEKASLGEQYTSVQNALDQKSKVVNEMIKPRADHADGKIHWVNQGNRSVWLSLGRADNLPDGMTFAVYDAEINDITEAKKKADVEVIRVSTDQAIARITEDDPGNPIMPGDLIHTPIWSPGEQEHFALTDSLDVDGDGKSDVHMIRNLIKSAGGVIDAELDDVGKLTGNMDGRTRWLVIGSEHTEKTDKKVLDARNVMRDRADELGVRTMTLPDLLQKTGWKEQTRVVTFGPGADPDQFRAKPPEGVPRRSTGNIFQPRQPRSGGRSAF